MKKIAILGFENSHAWSFSEKLAPKDGVKTIEDMELIGCYADLSTEDGQIGKENILKRSSCDQFADSFDAFLFFGCFSRKRAWKFGKHYAGYSDHCPAGDHSAARFYGQRYQSSPGRGTSSAATVSFGPVWQQLSAVRSGNPKNSRCDLRDFKRCSQRRIGCRHRSVG